MTNQHRFYERLAPLWNFAIRLSGPVAILALVVLFFNRVVLDRFIIIGDTATFMFPAQREIDLAIRSGHLPLWTPNILLGAPLIADPQTAPFNPLFMIYHLIPYLPPLQLKTFDLMEIFYVGCGGIFAYYLAREIGLGWGRWLAAVIFTFSGFFMVHVVHLTWAIASVWIPLLLLLEIRLLERPAPRYAVGIGVTLALSVFSGYPQTTYFSAWMMIFFFIWRHWDTLRRRDWKTVLKSGVWLGAGLAVGVTISAIQVLPTAVLTANSIRSGANFTEINQRSLGPDALVTMILPNVFGANGSFPYIGTEITHSQKYVGLTALILTIIGSIQSLRKRDEAPTYRYARFFVAMAWIALIGSFGLRLQLYRVFELLPFMTIFRRPATLFPFALLGMAIVSGIALEELAGVWAQPGTAGKRDQPLGYRQYAGIALFLSIVISGFYAIGAFAPNLQKSFFQLVAVNAAIGRIAAPAFTRLPAINLEMLPYALALVALFGLVLFWPRARKLAGILLILFSILDLYHFNTATWMAGTLYTATDLTQLLPEIATVKAEGLGQYRATQSGKLYAYNGAQIAGIEEMSGYNPLILSRVQKLLEIIPSVNSPLFNLLNVKYMYLDPGYEKAAKTGVSFTRNLGQHPAVIYTPAEQLDPIAFTFKAANKQGYQLWINNRVLPRFFSVNRYQVIPQADERLTALASTSDPAQTVILQEPFDGTLGGQLVNPPRVIKYEDNQFTVEVEVTGGPTMLFVSVPYYPEWQATVDGSPVHIYVADHAFMAIPLQPGKHTAQFAIESIALKAGAVITLLGLVAAFAWLVWEKKYAAIRDQAKTPRFHLSGTAQRPDQDLGG